MIEGETGVHERIKMKLITLVILDVEFCLKFLVRQMLLFIPMQSIQKC